jgi:hypothetical protein
MAAVNVPEVDALLKRWAEEVKAIALLLNVRDLDARIELENLSSNLTQFDRDVRLHAVAFEEKHADLGAME